MALESSELLANTIISEADRPEKDAFALLKMNFEKTHGLATRKRLRACSLIHRLSFSPRLAGAVIAAGSLSDTLLKSFASSTRPAKNV